MKNPKINNDSEGAENPSNKTNNAGIQTQANDSYQQSLYIAAISQFIGCKGLASPAIDTLDGVEYTFDFYHPECGKVFKVFKSDDLSEYEKYTQYSGNVVIIVDADNAECELEQCSCCGDKSLILPHELGEKLYDIDSTLVYYHHYLCEFDGDATDGTAHWLILVPIALQKLKDDEFGGEEEFED
jgi:hypothetical protein